jgi:hypothetical protein
MFYFPFVLIGLLSFVVETSLHADTAITAKGRAAAVGEVDYNLPANNQKMSGIRVPLGLTLEAYGSENFKTVFDLDMTYYNYPHKPLFLGRQDDTWQSKDDMTPYPLSPLGYRPKGEGIGIWGNKQAYARLSQAYLSYALLPVGVIQAGRFARHWGLGIWLNSEWNPYGGAISTTDAVSVATIFGPFKVQALWEVYEKALNGRNDGFDAGAVTVQAILGNHEGDVSSSGFNREIGFLLTYFENAGSKTEIKIMDAYAMFSLPRFNLGTELLFAAGTTRSALYQNLGGNAPGETPYLMDTNQDIMGFAGLMKGKFLLSAQGRSDESIPASLREVEEARKKQGTFSRLDSQMIGAQLGYVSGDPNQFVQTDLNKNTMNGIWTHPNISPALLMFNFELPYASGMPAASLTNVFFAKLDYEYENKYGSFKPAFIWGKLNQVNPQFGNVCSDTVFSPCDRSHYGSHYDLGFEVDLSYRYVMDDLVELGADAGYWFVGRAWKNSETMLSPNRAFGFRLSIAKVF